MNISFFQSKNASLNYYTDSYFNYINASSIALFQDLLTFKNTYHPSWTFNTSNPDNRIIYNKNSIYELIIYKNIYTVIPLCIIDITALPKEYELIKSFICKYIIASHGNNPATLNLINTIGYKFIFYSPYSTFGNISNINNNQQSSITILQTQLQQPLYELKIKITFDQSGNLINGKNQNLQQTYLASSTQQPAPPSYNTMCSMVVI